MLEYFYVVALGFPGTVLRQIKLVLINELINFLQFETTDSVGIHCSVYQHKSMLADIIFLVNDSVQVACKYVAQHSQLVSVVETH